MAETLWDVYVWPITDASEVKKVATSIAYKPATVLYNHYLEHTDWDAYMVPAGTKLFY